ncbi:cbb3-type cytochrome c oxidase subunit I [Conexibacter sp. DBS9H8]|uniref:cytochrome c oxidase subunit I n=1 Tax=Conexibacter sp. DBS9H8 TaxID=2937801 RepID=UPI00200FD3AE|nr:cbb3-type cytochrome c oxidase subunit I [Conexibacter sp. DBS9H8]
MSIKEEPVLPQQPGGVDPTGPLVQRAWWKRPAIHTALLGAIVGYLIGRLIGDAVTSGVARVANSNENDIALVLGYLFATLGWLGGLGVFNDIVRQALGRPTRGTETYATPGVARYFRYTLDHKVIGVQYLVAMIAYFCTAGLFAMAIRTELLSPTTHVFGPGTYIEIVGEHGTMMMMLMTSVVLGPFGNYLVPLMIGSKRTAFPRLSALSFWLTPAAFIILLSAILWSGFPTGWTGYAPLSNQATQGMDAYLVAFGLMGISMILAGINMLVTIICYRAPGMGWRRLPIFVWSMLATAFLMVLAAPVLVGGMYLTLTDRTIQTAFFVPDLGGSPFLYENLFWFFGHPEVYILALPGFGIVSEIIPVFCRRPLFGYKTAAAGMIGVSLLSFFVWQHHLFDSGIDPNARPLFMLTTELISVPTGFIYLVALGTFWRAKIRLTVPMLFAIGMYFNFLIGGISGVFLSDVAADTTAHGTFFVLAHFHYTIMGGLIFAFMAGIYYWLPKIMGIKLNERLGKIQFWTMFIFFNSTFLPMFAIGAMGQPRRVFEYAHRLQTLNDWVSISAFLLGGSILIFVVNFLWSTVVVREPEVGNPWQSRGLEWQISSPPPAENFARVPLILSAPYEYGVKDASPVADLDPPPDVLAGAVASMPAPRS